MATRTIHERTHHEIQARIKALAPGAADEEVPEHLEQKQREELDRLRRDMRLLRAHWPTTTTVTRPSTMLDDRAAPVDSKGCNDRQPCPQTLGLAERYDTIGLGY